MSTNKMHKLPGFTAEEALVHGASTSYAGLPLRVREAGTAEPAARVVVPPPLPPRPVCYWYCGYAGCMRICRV
jgi:hypothetical protein